MTEQLICGRKRRYSDAPLRMSTAKRNIIVSALGALTAIPSCGGGTEPSDQPSIERDLYRLFQTDALSYTLRRGINGYEAVVPVEFTNRTGTTVYVPNCNGYPFEVLLEKEVSGAWTPAWATFTQPGCRSPVITLQPGATWRMEISIFGAYPENALQPKFSVGDVDGVYRAAWNLVMSSYSPTPPYGNRLPYESRLSNRFILRTR